MKTRTDHVSTACHDTARLRTWHRARWAPAIFLGYSWENGNHFLGESWKMLGKLYHWDIWDNHWDKFGQIILDIMGINLGRICYSICAVRSGKLGRPPGNIQSAMVSEGKWSTQWITGRWAQKDFGYHPGQHRQREETILSFQWLNNPHDLGV